MRLSFIREMQNGRIRLGIESGDGVEKYTLSRAQHEAMGLILGMELSDDVYCEILRADGEHRCMQKALSLLSYGDNTASMLYMKLIRSGHPKDIASDCVKECVRLGYINEHRQLERLILNEANTALRGRLHIRAKLSKKGYKLSDIDLVTDELVERGEIDFKESLERLYLKKGAATDEERRALAFKHGYRSCDFE